MIEQEIIKSAENVKKWCKKNFSVGTCDCPFIEGDNCAMRYAYPQDWEIPKPKPRISEFEYEYLKRFDKEYKYIARDNDDRLFAYKSEPRKSREAWKCRYLDFLKLPLTDFLNFITWDDGELTSIRELIKEYEVYQNAES